MKRQIASKIYSREDLISIVKKLKTKNKKIGLSSGVFDLVNASIIEKFSKFKTQCDFLVVAIRSDYGAILYEDNSALLNESDRSEVIGSLSCVDAVVIFNEASAQELIKEMQVDLIFELEPNEIDPSVMSFINKQRAKLLSFDSPAPILFLDRDGTIIEHVEYVHEPEKVKIIPGAITAIKRFQDEGFRIAIVTNQPGINLGYFTKEDLYQVNKVIIDACKKEGVVISRIYYSPSASFEVSEWRKPRPGMIEQGLKDLRGIREKSVMVGDSEIDIEAGKNANLGRVVLISMEPKNFEGVEVCESLSMLR